MPKLTNGKTISKKTEQNFSDDPNNLDFLNQIVDSHPLVVSQIFRVQRGLRLKIKELQNNCINLYEEFSDPYYKLDREAREIKGDFTALIRNYDKKKASAYLERLDRIQSEIDKKKKQIKAEEAAFKKSLRAGKKGGQK